MALQDSVVVAGLPLSFDLPALGRSLRIDSRPAFMKRLEKLAGEAMALARPQGVARLFPLAVVDGEHTKIGDVIFTSALMVRNMGQLARAFPYLATEGPELAAWSEALGSVFDRMLASALQEKTVLQYRDALEARVLEQYGIRQLSDMSPGSLALWPIEQQAELFELMAPVPDELQLTLNSAFLMKPEYSVSGIFFETEQKYYNCRLCPQANCRNRKAAYQAG